MLNEDAINLHRALRGKIEIHNRVSIDASFGHEEIGTLGLIYTPGVASVAQEISKNKELIYDYTSKWNNVAIVCDGILEILAQKERSPSWKENLFCSRP